MKLVKYTPQEGRMVPGWKVGEEREVSDTDARSLLNTDQFTEVTKAAPKKPEKPQAKPKERE
ncbi:MAG: hypothetical protein AAF267_01515 [Deinococcota bacterium]